MTYQIIRQPGGLFAIFSTYTDTIIVYDATRAEIVDWFIEQETAELRKQLGVKLDHVETGNPEKVYFQFAMSWDEALETDRVHGGEVHAVFSELDST